MSWRGTPGLIRWKCGSGADSLGQPALPPPALMAQPQPVLPYLLRRPMTPAEHLMLQCFSHLYNLACLLPTYAPLSATYRFIKWTQETFAAGGHKAELLPLLERCTRELQADGRYAVDVRYLRVWVQYVSSWLAGHSCLSATFPAMVSASCCLPACL